MKRFVSPMLACSFLWAATTHADDWIPLQDGKSLAGWKAAERPESWRVEKGAFVSRGDRSHLFYVGEVAAHDFTNFEFSAQVMTSPGANSGIYVHTRWQGPGWPEAGYELQVINSNPPAEKMDGYVEHKMTGSIYAVRNTWIAPAKDNVWFNYRIRVVGKTIQTFVDDRLICEYAEGDHPFRPADKRGRLLGSGTFALQAHDPGSVVKFRDMKVKLLPADARPPAHLLPIADAELDALLTQASNDNIPLLEIGSPPDDAAEAERFAASSRRYGMSRGYPQIPGTPTPVTFILDRASMPDPVGVLREAKARGQRVAFVGTGATVVDEVLLKRRLQAIKAAGLEWQDFWVPGKP